MEYQDCGHKIRVEMVEEVTNAAELLATVLEKNHSAASLLGKTAFVDAEMVVCWCFYACKATL